LSLDQIKRFFAKPIVFPFSIILLSLIIRSIYLLMSASETTFQSPGGDAEIYVSMAKAFLDGSWESHPFFRAPGYPAFIALLEKFTGAGLFWPIRVFQIVLSAFGAAWLSLLTKNWFGKRAGWIAGILWTFYGLSIYFDGEGLIASLFVSLFALMLYTFDIYLKNRKTVPLIIAAFSLGLMTIFRANALLFWPVFLFFTLYPLKTENTSTLKNRIVATIISFVLIITIISPALIHNYKTSGRMAISVQGGINLYIGNHPVSKGAFAVDPDFGSDWTEAQITQRAINETGKLLNPSEVSSFYVAKTGDYISANFSDWLKLEMKKVLILFNFYELANNRAIYPYLNSINGFFSFILLMGFPVVLIFSIPFIPKALAKQKRCFPILLFGAAHVFMLLVFFVNARYRFPLIPVLLPFTGFGILYLSSNWKELITFRRNNRVVAFALILVSVLVFLPSHTTADDERASWLYHRGTASLRLERYREALKSFTELTEQYPQYKNGFNNLGVVFLHGKKMEKAQECFEIELKYHPNNAKALNNLGTIFQHNGQIEKAVFYYKQALVSDPSNSDARFNLAHIYHEKSTSCYNEGLLKEALESAYMATEFLPDNPNYMYNYAILLTEVGNPDSAKVVLEKLLSAFSHYPPAELALQQLNR